MYNYNYSMYIYMRIIKYIKKYRKNRNKYLRYNIHDISENTCVYIYTVMHAFQSEPTGWAPADMRIRAR